MTERRGCQTHNLDPLGRRFCVCWQDRLGFPFSQSWNHTTKAISLRILLKIVVPGCRVDPYSFLKLSLEHSLSQWTTGVGIMAYITIYGNVRDLWVISSALQKSKSKVSLSFSSSPILRHKKRCARYECHVKWSSGVIYPTRMFDSN